MTVDLIVVGKTDSAEVASLVELYRKRINFYIKFNIITIPDPKRGGKVTEAIQRTEEGVAILKLVNPQDYLALLDEHGKELTSMEFASWMQRRMGASTRRLCFVIGGPYGFAQAVHDRADEVLSLSRMTFSHQIVRALFTEQLYRAFSILNNEPYHHE